jgi:serine/threonine-protein phosphatase 4 regulatory subunit 1
LLTSILCLCHDNSDEELRMTGCVLLSSLTLTFGLNLATQFVTPELISLAEDPVFRVRKSAALNLKLVMAETTHQDAINRLQPAYCRLGRDDMHRVRKMCAEAWAEPL